MLRIAVACATWPVAQVVSAGGIEQVGGVAGLLVDGGPWALASLLLLALWRKDREAAKRAEGLEREKAELTDRLFALAETNARVTARIDETLRSLVAARRGGAATESVRAPEEDR